MLAIFYIPAAYAQKVRKCEDGSEAVVAEGFVAYRMGAI